jgi:beta-ketoacyl synthase-like protein
MRVFVEALGLLGPGLNGWTAGASVLKGASLYAPSDVVLPPADALPAAERRRTGLSVKLALCVGLEALAQTSLARESVATVFTSSGGDGQVIHEICQALATVEREVSPTRFHNSVHNAPAGYWGIALRSHASSTSLCAYDWSFAAGLLEACVQCVTARNPVLMISYDLPYPEPLDRVRPILETLGIALLMAPHPTPTTMAQLDVQIGAEARSSTPMVNAGLEALRTGNPTGRALPLLAAVAERSSATVFLEYLNAQTLSVKVSPCS